MASKTVAEFAARTAIGPFGSRMKSDLYTDSGVPVIRGTNLTGGKILSGDWVYVSEKTADDLSNCCVYPGDLVFPHRGAIGEVGIVPDQFPRYVMSSSLMTLSCDRSKAHPDYVFYYFKSAAGRHKLLENASQVGTPGIGQPLSTLRAIEVPLPRPSSQLAIAKTLGDLDSKIDLNRRINQTLEAMAQAIFKSWFVDFDPVKAKIAAKAEGRDPLRAAMSAISGKHDVELDTLPPAQYTQLAATAALFPDEMEGSELGEIPKGWAVEPIGELVECVGGATPDTKNSDFWEPAEYAWTTPKDLSGANSPVLLSTERKISSKGVEKIGSGLLPEGTLLMSSRAPIGYLALTKMPVAINQGYIAMPPGGKLPPLYLYFWCKENLSIIKGNANGSTFLEISKKAFRPILALNPSSELLGEFLRRVKPLFYRIVAGEQEALDLAGLRDTLLPQLLSGELSVAEAMAEVEA